MISIKDTELDSILPDLQQIELDAADLASEAGAILFKYFGKPGIGKSNLGVEYKDANNTDPVTRADTEVQQSLAKEISSRYPSHGVVGEEDKAKEGFVPETVWILDPLDGTRNFLHGLPAFASSIGVLHKGVIVAGAIFLPWPGESEGIVLHSSLGRGARINGESLATPQIESLDPAGIRTLPGSFSAAFKFEGGFGTKSGELRMVGSIAYELALVALGVTQYAVVCGAHLWDVAAGISILTESGGNVLKHVKVPLGSRIIGSVDAWEEIGRLVEISETGHSKYEDFRKLSPPFLAAPASIISEMSANIVSKNIGIRGMTGALFKR